MLRTNLATRAFYNERAAHLVIGIAAAIVLAITALNVIRVVTLSRHHTELASRADADRAEAQRLTAEAARIRKTINKDELTLVVAAAQEANVLIDQRTFSWTEFFNQIESTLPPDVMLTSVRPSVKGGVTHVAMSVLARQAPDLEEFMDKLETTGSFTDVVLASEDRTDEGLFRAQIESAYTRPDQADAEPSDHPPAAAAETPGAARGTATPPGSAPQGAKSQRAGGRQ